MQSLEKRVSDLEKQIGQGGESPNFVCAFVRPEDGFQCAYLRLRTGEEVIQREEESDADFVIRAKAAGFGGHHERT